MNNWEISAFSWNQQAWEVLEPATSLRLSRSLSSPADSFVGVFHLRWPLPALAFLNIHQDGELLFEGMVDTQRTLLDANGLRVELEARSKGCALLDNEAEPCQLAKATLAEISSRCAMPYGFEIVAESQMPPLPTYTIHKGRSEWDAIVDYTRLALGKTPHVAGDEIRVGFPKSGAPVVLSNKDGVPFTSLCHDNNSCKVPSHLHIRDRQGLYSTVYANPDNLGGLSRRRRFVTPSDEFVLMPQWDARQRVRRAMLEREIVTAELPGIYPFVPGQEVRIADPAMPLYNLLAEEVTLQSGAQGTSTRLRLISSLYYD